MSSSKTRPKTLSGLNTGSPFERTTTIESLREFARIALSNPPRWPWVERHERRGQLVAQFVLPLALCQSTNRTRHAQGWQLQKTREQLMAVMMGQLVRTDLDLHAETGPKGALVRALHPLQGRPQVRAIRFTSTEPDASANWQKQAIDLLLPPKVRRTAAGIKRSFGLGLIADDRPAACEVRAWSEFAPRGMGFVLLEVSSGGNE